MAETTCPHCGREFSPAGLPRHREFCRRTNVETRTREAATTPGPWTVDKCRHGYAVVSPKAVIVDTLDDEGRYGPIENEADAHLLAAAPDLLTELRAAADAAREMIRVLDDGHDWEGLHHSTPERGAYDRLKLAAWNAERIIARATAPTPDTESHD
jgi:hypothetical protein